MSGGRGLRASAALAFAALHLAAAAQTLLPEDLRGVPSPESRADAVMGELHASFERAYELYTAEIAQRPYDVLARLAQCRFVEEFGNRHEYLSWGDELYDLGERCMAAVDQDFPGHPEVSLSKLEQTFDDEQRMDQGAALLARPEWGQWTQGQRARLYTLLANALDRMDLRRRNQARVAEYARQALAYDENADVRLVLASSLFATRDRAGAREALSSPFDGHDPDDNWYRLRKVHLLHDLGEREAALAEAKQLAQHDGYYDKLEAARLLRHLGAFDLALRELEALGDAPYSSDDERERFMLALDHGEPEQALAAYSAWRDLGWEQDALAINRFALFLRHPGLPWSGRDLLGVLGGLAAAAMLALATLVILFPIHYRGLVLRARSGAAAPQQGWQLRHAWLALLGFAGAEWISLYAVGPIDLTSPEDFFASGDSEQLGRYLLVQSLLVVVLLLPLARIATRNFGRWQGEHWGAGKSIAIGAGLALLFRLPLLIALLAAPNLVDAMRFDNELWRMLDEVHRNYGAAAAFWVVAIVAPVTEEFVFRGVLLRAFSQHVSFAAANAAQAALFAGAHFDLGAAPYLFAFGLLAGSMARRSGGLLASMSMHSLFNFFVALLLVA